MKTFIASMAMFLVVASGCIDECMSFETNRRGDSRHYSRSSHKHCKSSSRSSHKYNKRYSRPSSCHIPPPQPAPVIKPILTNNWGSVLAPVAVAAVHTDYSGLLAAQRRYEAQRRSAHCRMPERAWYYMGTKYGMHYLKFGGTAYKVSNKNLRISNSFPLTLDCGRWRMVNLSGGRKNCRRGGSGKGFPFPAAGVIGIILNIK